MKRLSFSISCDTHLTIYKSLVLLHLDYVGLIFDRLGNANVESKLERVQYVCLAITGAFLGTNRDSIYGELGLESLSEPQRYIINSKTS